MLTKSQRFIMDILIEAFPPEEQFQSGTFYSKLHLDGTGISFREIPAICRSLQDLKCISRLKLSSSGLVDFLQIEHNGRRYREIMQLEKAERWKERLWGFISALVLWGLKELIMWLIG